MTAIVEQDRYQIEERGTLWSVNVFKGAHAPLMLAETELASPAEGVHPPAWLGDEASQDLRHQGVYLSLHPYPAWKHDV